MPQEQAMTEAHVAQDKLMQDFSAVVSDTERLLKSLAGVTGEKAQAVRADIERNLETARVRLSEIERAAVERGRAAVHATDAYVHENPWQSVAAAAAIAGIAGMVIGLLIARK
jgi:ElaB/YqjD/DUF883 family membrane-anchored ribosome-binding protein